ncbi:DNA-binding transcriptional regulator, LysR family [Salinibacillus kushneri]|uniref:DNA-binding transcriptional regulator, LysR family n=1 Tax=Salinibacillus kushneri TaxID=237682 RepID=A0A1I0ASZ4_9BACI|nr:LysR family transcriptional regulator [Salinibacillus kushneri]SES97292.1 DNA-binding transcriptional regulator, LysR family [Salinibacillus kushneri]
MEIEELRSFLTVVQEESISKAAVLLHLTQPTLSTRIRRLEEKLGFPLLERSWDGVVLTHEGHYFLPYAIKLLQDMQNAQKVITSYKDYGFEQWLKETNDDKLYITIGINPWLAPVFSDAIIKILSHEFPHQKYQLITRTTNSLKCLLRYGRIDVAIYYENEEEITPHEEYLLEDEMILLCSQEIYSFLQGDLTRLRYLSKPFLLFDNPGLANNRDTYRQLLKTLQIEQLQLVDDLSVMLSYITSNIGFTVLPNAATLELQNIYSTSIKCVPIGEMIQPLRLKIAYEESIISVNVVERMTEQLTSRLINTF